MDLLGKVDKNSCRLISPNAPGRRQQELVELQLERVDPGMLDELLNYRISVSPGARAEARNTRSYTKPA